MIHKNIDWKEVSKYMDKTYTIAVGHGMGCGACAMFNGSLERLVNRRSDLNVVCLYIGDNNEWVNEFNITSLPTALVYKEGKLIDRFEGYAHEDDVEKRLI